MRPFVFPLLAFLASTVSAHFQLQFPPPRGPFNEDNEPNFCDGYTSGPSTNRTQFPLSGGIFTLNSEHPTWTAGVLVSTAENVTSFANFSQVNSFFQVQGEGGFCIPLDFSKSNVTGLHAGQNITIQIVFDGGDGQLYQCADLTLAENVSVSSVDCKNATSSGGGTSGSGNTGSSAASNQAGHVLGLSTLAAVFGLMLL